MNFPGEELVSTAIETLSNGIIKKIDESEARRDREFTYKLKELEFYKSNYDKELRNVFDYWFELVRVTHMKENINLTSQEREECIKTYNKLTKVSKIAEYKMNTLKYGGAETGRVFAIESKLHQKKYRNQPKTATLYMWCAILSVLKRDILGQYVEPTDIIQVLVNDYDENEKQIIESKEYIAKIYKNTYGEKPYWA